MKKIICLSFCIVFVTILQAQSLNSNFNGAAFAEGYDVSGTPFTEINKNDFDGTPYLNDNWTKGQVKMKSGMVIKNIDLKLNLYGNQLLFKKNDTIFMFANPVSEFTLLNADGDSAKRILFRCGYPDATPTGTTKFYQVLADGSKLHFVRYVYKVLQDEVNYGGPVRRQYQQKELWFIYDSGKGILVPVKNSKALIKSLPDYSQQIRSFEAGNKLSKEEDYIKLVNYINQS